MLALAFAPSLVTAADAPPAAPVAHARPVETPPVIDGEVAADPAWATAEPLTAFWQTTPDEGQPASERTEVRILYSGDTLYVGVICRDREPGRIVVNETRRDADLDDADSFQVILDTYLDGQNGFVFGTNAAGLEYDGQVTNEGADEGGSSLGGFNRNWDATWKVKALIGDFGWSAEFAIPFRSLRYGRATAQTWGVNFQRNIRRRNERSYWSPLARQHGLFRLSSAGRLEGLRPPRQRNLAVTPYALANSGRTGERTDTDVDVGGDLKYGITPSLTLDLTVNTDFAQVEADEQQVNLDRFSLFYPEKRPFFLENAGFFAVGTPGEVEPFFSRRIGIGPAGEIIPILGGGRVSGKIAGVNVGLLDMQTRDVPGVAPANNFAVLRAFREMRNRSGLGIIGVSRQATGDAAMGGDHNRAAGIDGRLGIGRRVDLSGYALRTFTPGATEAQHAWHGSASFRSPSWEISGKLTDVGEDFDPQVGFVRRRGYRKPETLVFHTHRFARGTLGLHEARPHVSYRGFWKPDGFHESGFLHVDNHLEWRSGWQLHTGVNHVREGLRQAFQIVPGFVIPPGTYDNTELQIVGQSNQGARLSGEVRVIRGGFFDGDRLAVNPEVRLRVGDSFTGSVEWDRNDVRLTAGRFVTNLARARLSYSFTPRLYVQTLLQYNDRIDNWSTNLRLGWLQAANTGVFVVYNDNRDTGTGSPRDHGLVLKVSRTFDLLD